MKKTNYGVYHIACMGDWKVVFNEQLETIKNSNILNVLDHIYCSILYKDVDDIEYVKEKTKNLKISIKFTSNDFKLFEFPGLKIVKDLCKQEECNVLYIHTKGVSISNSDKKGFTSSHMWPNKEASTEEEIDHVKQCVFSWRKYMEHFLIKNYELCIDSLINHDMCGVNLFVYPPDDNWDLMKHINVPGGATNLPGTYSYERPYDEDWWKNTTVTHYQGNFWWARASHINKLPSTDKPELAKTDGGMESIWRYAAEKWVGSVIGKFDCLWYLGKAGYTQILNIKDYDKYTIIKHTELNKAPEEYCYSKNLLFSRKYKNFGLYYAGNPATP